MAKKIEEIVVGLRFEGADKLDKLSSGFRELGKAIAPSDKLLRSARQGVLDYAKSLGDTEQVSQGVIKAFEALRSQATSGGTVYRQLSKDINKLKDDLKGLQGEYGELGRVAKATDAQLKAQFPASKPEAFKNQITALRRELDKLKISSKEYGNALTEITIRETGFGRAQARQGVIAGAQAVGSPRIAQALPTQELPNTLAALQQRISELRQDFQNLDRTSSDYLPTLREINTLTREYTNATVDGNAARKNEIRDRIASLQAINAENGALRAQDAIEKSIARNARKVARRQGPAPIEQPMRPISALYQSISDVGMANIGREIEMMGNGYEQVAVDINAATKASNGSIASLQAQRSAWQQLRTQLDPASAGFKKTGREIELLDRRLEKLQVRQRRGLGPMGATQAAGAVISGGIFGGPEGAIGGIAGTIAGGVPGAFAGAAAGAQLGIMRKALGEMASFTAEIDKQRIALRSVVGSQEQYQQALQFIDATSRRAAIPHDQLTRQFTQLAASVIGAGGNVNVAERAFRGMAAGIRGTGGSLEAMQSAMLATSQVFSKGKVSAEEIRQQIGERLPGAFTTFATAIGKTPAMLDKMLQKGEVTLDDFMLLIEELIKTYEPSMDRIAASSQAAGDRMQVTFARLREAIGRELQPVGAQFQEIFANFFEENEQAIVNFASSIAGLARSIADNAGTIAESLKVLIGLAGIAGSAFAFTKVAAGVTFVAAAIFQMGGVASVASLAVTTLKTALIAIPGVNVFAGAIAGLALLGKAVYDTNDTFRNFVDNIGGVIASDFKNSVDGMAADASTAAGNIQTAYEDLTAKLDPIGNFIKQLFKDVFKDTSDSAENSATASSNAFDKFFSGLSANAAGAFNGLNTIISNWWSGLPAPIRSIFEGNAASLLIGAGQYAANLPGRTQRRRPSYVLGDKQQGPAVPLGLPNRNKRPSTDLPFSSTSAPGVSGATNAKDAAALAAEQQRLAETVMQQRLRIEDTLFKHQVELDRKRYDLQKQLNDQQTQNRIAAETGVQRSVTADFQQLKQRLREITERQTQANDRVRLAEQALKTASAMASVTTGGPSAGMAGIYRQGSIGPTSTGPHFDIKRSDGGFYGRTALDKYVSVNGQPLSSGVTVPGGEYGARRSYGGHAGRDYAFGAGAGLSLMGGAQWVGNRPGTAHGDETAFRTPDGKVYKILHGKFEQAGVAAQQRRGVKAEGTAGVESIDLQAAQRERQLEKEFEAPQRQEAIRSFILQQTDAIREQNATMQNSIELEVKRASLLGQGYGPERIESMMKVAELEQLRSQRVAKLGELARSNPEMTGELTTAIGEVNAEYTNLIATIERLYEIQSSPQARLQQAVGAVRQELATLTDPVNQIVGAANAIGSSFGSAFKGLVSGSMSAKEALASFFQSTADYFLDMASKIITQWITMTILNSVLKLFPGGAGAAGGGLAGSSLPGGFANPLVGAYTNANGNAFAANGIVPYAKGGIVNSPTLFKFAKGGAMQTGIMGEAGAEAVMPLKRGPDGKLGVAATGGGGVNVVVNVDAKGSAVQGDQGQGNELGRVIAGAVQAELIKQQRPGGLLTR